MRGINKVILVGNIGRAEAFESESGVIMKLSVATNESWQDKESGEKKTATEWHRVVIFGRLAGALAPYLTKGMGVYIEGKLRTRKYQGNDGTEKYTTEIIVDFGGNVVMLGGGDGEQEQYHQEQPQQPQQQRYTKHPQPPQHQPPQQPPQPPQPPQRQMNAAQAQAALYGADYNDARNATYQASQQNQNAYSRQKQRRNPQPPPPQEQPDFDDDIPF